ncbi:MAG: chemotaxis protein CheW, partial [Anaerovoracaceae bacterium]
MTMEQVTAIDSSERTLQGRYLTFYMDEELYGMDIQHIIEIIGVQPITVVPEMPEYIRGITNLRGKIIPVMDARLRFKLEERDYDDRTCIIVLETGDVSMGMIVDAVSEVLELYSD